MDISNLTSQITALRAETQERSISPERVGSLLQQLANLIKSAAESAATQNDIYEITDNALSNIRASVAATANGLSITLTYSELDGEEFPQTVTLPLDEDRFIEELNKRRATSRRKEDVNVTFSTEGTYGTPNK
jgi:hypothetical protein